MKLQNNQFLSIEQVQAQYTQPTRLNQASHTQEGLSFQDILTTKTQDVQMKFSKHAINRLESRNIEMTDAQIERLKEGTAQANEKGIKDSLVIVDQMAFIVNVPSNTVVTAMNQSETNENIFTNIDGAVII